MSGMTLPDFLLARIAEDEAQAHNTWEDYHPNGPEPGTWYHWVLAECAAKRQIVARWEYRWQEAEDATEQHIHGMFASQATGLGGAVRSLAAVYADHPDYDDEWCP